ncbi:hypothetical protein C7453_10563 [Gluconacetobacter liquefaciens]|uniref:Uncharacterized protein n=1 Tax=Gluconacetobacter liquefaciens TaxID=89584 RepID=A0A370G1N7_GLULI|nr:hypothetical protein C7453_10563 [Gluconacetobacter liquefaciens]
MANGLVITGEDYDPHMLQHRRRATLACARPCGEILQTAEAAAWFRRCGFARGDGLPGWVVGRYRPTHVACRFVKFEKTWWHADGRAWRALCGVTSPVAGHQEIGRVAAPGTVTDHMLTPGGGRSGKAVSLVTAPPDLSGSILSPPMPGMAKCKDESSGIATIASPVDCLSRRLTNLMLAESDIASETDGSPNPWLVSAKAG